MTLTARQRLKYILSDYLTINVGWLVFNVIRYFSLPPGFDPRPLQQWLFSDFNIRLGQVFYPLLMLALYWLSGFYNKVALKSRIDELGNTALVSLIGMLLIYFGTLMNDNVPERLQNYELMFILWSLLLWPCFIGRIVITNAQRRRRSRGEGVYNTLIVGNAEDAARLADRLADRRRNSDFNVVGFVSLGGDTSLLNGPVYNLDDIDHAKTDLQPQVLILGSRHNDLEANMALIARLFRTDLDIYIPIDLYQMITSNPRMSSVISEPLVNISTTNIHPAILNLKRLGDVIVSALALIVLAPAFLIIALAIKHDSKGPAFYLQERVGYHKKIFRIIKFRTMYTDAEASGPALSKADDPRITHIGRFLRKYRIDEFPQFWNVLRGDMSLVGPRPEREYYVRQIIERVPHYSLIHQVRPGITSWGMVRYGYAGNVDEMLERLPYDLLYLENVSLAVDMKILAHTVKTVLTGKGM